MAAAEAWSLPDRTVRLFPWLATLLLALAAPTLPPGRPRALFLLLIASSPLLLLYAAEARVYAILGLVALTLFLLASRGRPAWTRLVAVALLTAAALYLHYLGAFLAAAVAVVAFRRRRFPTLLAMFAGAVAFLPWVPIFLSQPEASLAWMREPLPGSAAGMLSSLGGAGRIPALFGPPLPFALFAAGIGIAIVSAAAVFDRSSGSESRDAALVTLLFLAGVLLVSIRRPVGFAGRSEIAVLPVWMWGIAAAGAGSAFARRAAAGTAAVGVLATLWLVPAIPRSPATGARLFALVRSSIRGGDVLVASGSLYLPARLAADRGELAGQLWALPAEVARHPGWFRAAPLSDGEREELLKRIEALPEGARVLFLVHPLLFPAELTRALEARGSLRPIASAPDARLFVWTAGAGTAPRLAAYRIPAGGVRRAIARSDIP